MSMIIPGLGQTVTTGPTGDTIPTLGSGPAAPRRRWPGMSPLGGGMHAGGPPGGGPQFGETGGETPGYTANGRSGLGYGPGAGAGGSRGFGPGMGTFNANSNLINSQITPQNSALTNWSQGYTQSAGDRYANFEFAPWQSVRQPSFGQSRDLLTGANTDVKGLNYNWEQANTQYGNAQNALTNAANAGRASLQGLQGLGVGSFAGGGANMADFGKSEAMLNNAMSGDLGQNFTYQGDTASARAALVPALQRAMNAPDRGQIAAESLNLLEQRSQPGFEQSLRAVTARNAAMGRRGSGITTNELGDVTLARERELGLARRDLANEAAARSLQDNMDRTNLALGVTQGLGSEDRGQYGVRQSAAELALRGSGQLASNASFNASQGEAASQRAAQGAQFGANFQRGVAGDIYGMGRDQSRLAMDVGDRYGDQQRDTIGLGITKGNFQRGVGNDLAGLDQNQFSNAFNERNAGRQDEFNRGNFSRNQFGDFANFLGNQQGNDRANRNEWRGERDYQYGLSRDAINDAYRQQGWEEQLRNNRYTRGLGMANFGYGTQGQYSDALGNAANRADNQANDNYGAFASFMQQLANMYGRGNTSGGPAPRPVGTQYSGPVYP